MNRLSAKMGAARGLTALAGLVAVFFCVVYLFAGPTSALPTLVLKARHQTSAGLHEAILQRNGYDCGPAAVANMLRLLHRDADLHELETAMHPAWWGTTITTIANTLQAHGVRARIVHARTHDISRQHLPFIALSRRHYIVVVGKTSRGFEVIDPSVGDIFEDLTSLNRDWSGWGVTVRG